MNLAETEVDSIDTGWAVTRNLARHNETLSHRERERVASRKV